MWRQRTETVASLAGFESFLLKLQIVQIAIQFDVHSLLRRSQQALLLQTRDDVDMPVRTNGRTSAG